MQTFPSCLNAPEGQGWLHFPLLRLQTQHWSLTCPAGSPPTPTLHQLLLQSGESWGKFCFLTAVPSLQKTPTNQNFKSQKSHSNYLIYIYIQPFNCWSQSIFYLCVSKKNNYFYLQRTNSTPTFLYTCHRFCSLIFIFLIDNQGHIQSVVLALSSACSEREADSDKLNNEGQKHSREGPSGTASSHCQVLVTSIF